MIRARVARAGLAGLTWLCGRLSIESALALAAGIGRLWVFVGAARTRRVREALATALPSLPPRELAELSREVFVHLAQGLVELLLLRGRQRAALLARVDVSGLEHLAAASRATASGGIVVVSAHLGNWELGCAKLASLGIALSVVYRGPRSSRPSVLDEVLYDLRGRAGCEAGGVRVEQIPMGHAGLPGVRALDAGRKLLVLLDQNAGREEGVFVEFFGRPACTRSGPIALAALRGVPVVPAFIRREAGGRRHQLEFQPALDLEPGARSDPKALERNVQRVTQVIEQAVRREPGQWIWTHRRWRTRPGSAVDPGFAGSGARV